MNSELILSLLAIHVPDVSVDYCLSLWRRNPFELKLTKSRQSKVGDFTSMPVVRAPPGGQTGHPPRKARITLNHDLNPFLFLITYIHEVAHYQTLIRFGLRVEAHGEEWKHTFKELMDPMLQENVFPPEILHELRQHMINPKASSFADSKLTRILRQYDPQNRQQVALDEVPEGSIFKLNGRYFKKGKIRRTRVLCREIKSKRQYLVPVDALISDVQLSLL